MANVSKLNLLKIVFYSLLISFLANCSGADFGGSAGESRPAVTGEDVPVQPEPPGPTEPPIQPEPSGDYKVYFVRMNDSGVNDLFNAKDVTLNIPSDPSGKGIYLFLHFVQPTNVILTGDTDQLAGVFLTANNTYESFAETSGNVEFPAGFTAARFTNITGNGTISMGSSLGSLLGSTLASEWTASGLISVENYSAQLGDRTCFDYGYDTDFGAVNLQVDINNPGYCGL